MRLDAGILSLAPSDLSRHLGCAHATTLALEAARGEREGPHSGGEYERLIFEKGAEHERAYLARLQASGREVAEIERSGSYADMAARTRSAMEAGADVIYQATFEIDRWRGHADFLRLEDGIVKVIEVAHETAVKKQASDDAQLKLM